MISRKTVIQAAVLPVFALLALGSGSPKKSSDKNGDPSPGTASTTTVTSAGDNKAKGSCYDAKRGACTETYNPYGIDSEKKLCESMGGAWTASAECPRKDTLWGVCTQMDPITTTEIYEKIYYYNEGANKNAGGGKDACDALTGKWEVGPASTATAKPAKAKKK